MKNELNKIATEFNASLIEKRNQNETLFVTAIKDKLYALAGAGKFNLYLCLDNLYKSVMGTDIENNFIRDEFSLFVEDIIASLGLTAETFDKDKDKDTIAIHW